MHNWHIPLTNGFVSNQHVCFAGETLDRFCSGSYNGTSSFHSTGVAASTNQRWFLSGYCTLSVTSHGSA